MNAIARSLENTPCLLVLAAGLLLSQTLPAAVNFTVTPPAVSNTYSGFITLQVTGLISGDTVLVQKFIDPNANGVIATNDWLLQQFQLTDGQAGMVIGGIVNSNVPGDTDTTAGQITAQLNFQNGDFMQDVIGQYAFVLSSPSGHFSPITNLFSVTNFPYGQKFTGNVVINGTSTTVPNAVVLLFPAAGKGSPEMGAWANNSGGYTIQAPPGTYGLAAIKSNYVVNIETRPVLTLGSGQTVTTNLAVTNATASVSGQLVNATNAAIGLPGLLLSVQATNGLMGVGFTDSNGNFTVGVASNSGLWEIDVSDSRLLAYGYVGWNNDTNVNSGATGLSLVFPKASALFYGSVRDILGNPLPGIEVEADDNNNIYDADGYTDPNGYYAVAALGGLDNNPWRVRISTDHSPANYLFGQPDLDQNGGTNMSNGEALLANFTGILATNSISGYLQDGSGTPISGVEIDTSATISNVYYQAQYVDTGANGYYSVNVANGTWTVSVSTCSDCNDGLPANYLSPPRQTVVISNDNGTANFVALLATNTISGYLKDNSGNPLAGIGIYANDQSDTNFQAYADTGANGNYSLNVANGGWSVGVNCNGGSDSLDNIFGPGNYQCPANLNLTITNNNGTANFTVPLCSGLAITTASLPAGQVNSYYDQYLQASSCSSSFTWSLIAGSLPPGFAANSSTGEIYGTPTNAGTFNFTVLVTDGNGLTTTQTLSLTINGGVLQVTTTSLSSGTTNVAYTSQQLTAIGGQPPYRWSLASGLLPPGLSIATNGLISGTPTTAGTSNFVVRVTDSLSATATQPLSLAVYPFSTSVTFAVTPPAVSNFYTGTITLQVGGLFNGETVLVEKFRDNNANGLIDAGDTQVQQFQLTDGQASVFFNGTTPVTNFNIPGDLTPADGAITARLNLALGGISQVTVAQYAFRLSSPTGRFAPITNLFNVTNSAFAQSFSGNVVCGATNVPRAIACLFALPFGPNSPVIATALADGNGAYRLNAPPATYLLCAFKNGFVASYQYSPVLALGANAAITTNLSLLPATCSISGSFVDAANSNAGLPCLKVDAGTGDGLITADWTDGNGNFSLPSTTDWWVFWGDPANLDFQGFLGLQSPTVVNTGSGSVAGLTIPLPRGTALVYGTVNDAQNHPLAGVRLSASQNDGSSPYVGDAATDQNGNYAMAVNNAGVWNAFISGNNQAFSNYLWSGWMGDTSLSNGQAVQWNFNGLLATNTISGSLKDDSGHPIPGVWLFAGTTVGEATFNLGGVTTDSNGNYSMTVGNGTWTVGIAGSGNGVLPANYLFPPIQLVVISNYNGTANFIAPVATQQITGHVQQNNGTPITGLAVWAVMSSYNQFRNTDASGNYSLGVTNGLWSVSLQTSGGMNSLDSILGGGNYEVPPSQSVAVTNNNGTANFTVQLCGGVSITTTSLPSGQVNSYYNQFLQASSCSSTFAWSLLSGSLPPGLTTNASTGEIYGTPTNAGTFNFTVQVIDGNDSSTNQALSIYIAPAPSTLQLTTPSLSNATQNAYYSTTLTATGGQPPYTWGLAPGSASLPQGLSLGTNSGVISGTPPSSGTKKFIVQVTDSAPTSASQVLSLTVNSSTNRPVIILTAPERPATNQFQFSFISASGVSYTIQYSTNLKSWFPVLTINGSGGTETVIDPNAAGSATRFYRVITP